MTPEEQARRVIDANFVAAGWVVQDRDEMNLAAGRGVAVREFPLARGHGFADYLLFVDGKAVGVLEAKPAGHTLTGVELQAEKYATGLPAGLNPPVAPAALPLRQHRRDHEFTNLLDPDPKSREVFRIHRPETLAEWLAAETLDAWVKALHAEAAASTPRPTTPSPRPCARDSRPCRRLERDFSTRTRSRRSRTWRGP